MDISADQRTPGVEEPVSTGTTIVACTYKDGVVLGCDSRVSIGNYIMNRASNKLAPLSDNTYMLRSGSAPDTQAISDYGEESCWAVQQLSMLCTLARTLLTGALPLAVSYFVHQLEAELQTTASVEVIANLVKSVSTPSLLTHPIKRPSPRLLTRDKKRSKA